MGDGERVHKHKTHKKHSIAEGYIKDNEIKIMRSQPLIGLRNMRDLWVEHHYFLRLYFQVVIDKSPAVNSTLNRLLYNQTQLGDNLAMFYGRGNGNRYTDLLQQHIMQTKEIVNFALAGKDITSIYDDWTINSRGISDFLAGLNPFLDRQQIRKCIQEHLATALQEAKDMIAGKWEQSITGGDMAQEVMINIYDLLSTAMKQQFKIACECTCEDCNCGGKKKKKHHKSKISTKESDEEDGERKKYKHRKSHKSDRTRPSKLSLREPKEPKVRDYSNVLT